MQDQELTGWFELSDQKPWEPGVYKIQDIYGYDKEWFSYWCGKDFHGGWLSIERALDHKCTRYGIKYTKWRGLSSDPNAKPKPKRSGNPKVTRYVVTSDGDAVATFASKALAEAYAKSIEKRRASVVWVETIRFRSPE